jgi:hypothetical protein
VINSVLNSEISKSIFKTNNKRKFGDISFHNMNMNMMNMNMNNINNNMNNISSFITTGSFAKIKDEGDKEMTYTPSHGENNSQERENGNGYDGNDILYNNNN